MTSPAPVDSAGASARQPRLEARVISLVTSTDRREAVRANLRELPFPWRFADAKTPDAAFALAPSSQRQIARFGRTLAPGEIGVFKSHVTVLETFERDPALEWLLVLEDDVWIDTAFPFAELVGFVERHGIHYVRLFGRRFKDADVLVQMGPHQLIRFRTDPYGAQAYLIDREGARRLKRNLRSIDMPIDDEIARFWEHGLDLYAIFPFPAVERSTVSTIEPGRGVTQAARRRRTLARELNRVRDRTAKSLANLRFGLFRRRRWAAVRWRPGAA